jgi:F-type H+-transporting ATPase subunit b
MNDRNEKIKKSLEYSEQTRQAAARLEVEYQQKIHQIKIESAELINLAKAEANKVRDGIIKKSQDEALDIIKKTREQLEYERQLLVQQLKPFVVDYAMKIVEKSLKEFSKDMLQRQRFEDILSSMDTPAVREKIL